RSRSIQRAPQLTTIWVSQPARKADKKRQRKRSFRLSPTIRTTPMRILIWRSFSSLRSRAPKNLLDSIMPGRPRSAHNRARPSKNYCSNADHTSNYSIHSEQNRLQHLRALPRAFLIALFTAFVGCLLAFFVGAAQRADLSPVPEPERFAARYRVRTAD